MLLKINGAKNPKAEWLNWAGFIRQKQEAEAIIPRSAAQAYLRLEAKNKVPKWVQRSIDREKVRIAAM